MRTPAASPSPLTVAHVIHSLGPGGAEAVLVELARAAPSSGLRLVVVGLSDAYTATGVDRRVVPQLRAHGATVYEMHGARYNPTLVVTLARLFRDEHVDIVHTHLKHADVVGGVAARLAGLPSVSTLHVIDVPTSWAHRLRVEAAAHARRHLSSTVIALSSAQSRWYRQYAGADAPITLLPNGVAEPELTRDRALTRAEMGVPDNTLLAMCVSLMRPEKGHVDLVEAIRQLPADVPLVLAMAGDGPLLERVRSTLDSDPRLCEKTQVLGFRRDVADLLAASDFVVQPSLEDALPTALISALAAARPIVATNVGGIPDIVAPGCGFLVEPHHPSALSAGIAQMANLIRTDARASEEMRRSARERYDNYFSANVWVRKLRTVYEGAMSARAAQKGLSGTFEAEDNHRRPLRVALVQFPPSGGLFQFSLQLGEALARGGEEVEVVTGPSPELTSREPNCRVHTILPTWHPTAGAGVPEWWRRLRRGLRAGQYTAAWAVLLVHLLRSRPDAVVWSAWQFPIDGWGMHLARKALSGAVLAYLAHEPVPLVEQPGYDQELYKTSGMTTRALTRAYADLDVAFVLGESAKRMLVDTWPITPPLHVIPHGDYSFVPAGVVPTADNTAPIVLSFGTITSYKGIDTLCEAWPLVRDHVPEAELIIAGAIGADVSRSALSAEVAKLDGVRLEIGYVPTHDVAAYFARARCVVLPYKRASQSGVAHLAHTLRRAVVATSVGDIPAVVHHGKSGLLVPPQSPGALAGALVRLLDDPQIARRMGEAGAHALTAGSSWDEVAARVSQALSAARRRARDQPPVQK